MRVKKNYTVLVLMALYALTAFAVTVRVVAEENNYTTFDSKFYLEASNNILEGNGPVISDPQTGDQQLMATWPIGYPLLIAVVSTISFTTPLIASKLVNLIFLALLFVMLYRRLGDRSILPAGYSFSFSMMEIYSHTWSEGVFIFFLTWMILLVEKLTAGKSSKLTTTYLCICLVSMVLVRYVGIVCILFCSAYSLGQLRKRELVNFRKILIPAVVAAVIVIIYLLINKYQTGGFFGEPRVILKAESWWEFFLQLVVGLFNEFAIAQNHFFRGPVSPWFALLFVLELGIIGYLITSMGKLREGNRVKDGFSSLAISLSVFYLLMLIAIKKMVSIDSFDYRILAPFSYPIYLFLLSKVPLRTGVTLVREPGILIMAFMLFSLFVNLPNQYLMNLIDVAF